MSIPSVFFLHSTNLPDERQGQYMHRVARPVELLRADGRDFRVAEANWFAGGALDQALAVDILILINLCTAEAKALIDLRREAGRPTLLEISDDPMAAMPWLKRDRPDPRTVAARLLQIAAKADGVQFSAEGLRARFGRLNRRTIVLPNIVDIPDTPPAPSPARDTFTIGWGGTRTHLADLRAIAPAIVDFCVSRDNVRFALMGSADFLPMFAELPAERFRHHPFGTYADYTAFLRTLDVGLVPAMAGGFNDGRSDVKPVELTMAGTAALIQSTPAYRHLEDLYPTFSTPEDLSAELARLADDPPLRAEIVQRGFKQFAESRSGPALRLRWKEWLTSFAIAPGTAERFRPVDSSDLWDGVELQHLRHADLADKALLDRLQALHADHPEHVQTRWTLHQVASSTDRRQEAEALTGALLAHPVYRRLLQP